MSFPRRGSRLAPARGAAVAALVAGLVLASTPIAGAQSPPSYEPPVDGPVVDEWRPPGHQYGPGNRGLDFATTPGEEVRAAAGGEVTFAGRIGPSAHVVVLHPDGIRTSYSFLASVVVSRGDRLVGGQVVGTAGPVLHFGARIGDRYIDPGLLLAGAVEVNLVPVGLRRPQDEARERAWLLESVADVVGGAWGAFWAGAGASAEVAGEALEWAGDGAELVAGVAWEALRAEIESRWAQAVLLGTYATQLPISPLFLLHAAEVWRRSDAFRESQHGCTPPSQATPPPPPGRRIAVLVAGFGSGTESVADVLHVDTARLGYAVADVAQFSYAGGRTPGVGALPGPAQTEYGPQDSTGDLRESGRRLRELLEAIEVANPGVPVDVIAHSQGGVVARLAVAPAAGHGSSTLSSLGNLITLGSPHHGADAATANALLGTTRSGEGVQVTAEEVSGGSLDGRSPAAGQLSERSGLVARLDQAPLPPGVRVTSMAAAGDLTVGALHSSLAGATNVIVPLAGASAHGDLPGSAAAQREIALALAGLGPTCRELGADLALAAGVSLAEDTAGLLLGAGALWLDRFPSRAPVAIPTAPGR